MRTCVLIPAFNEARYIANVVERTRQYVAEVVVIDDGSVDGTADIAQAAGATCLRLPKNCGAAWRLGIGGWRGLRLRLRLVFYHLTESYDESAFESQSKLIRRGAATSPVPSPYFVSIGATQTAWVP